MINFPSLNCHWLVLLDQIPLKLDREGIKEKEDGERAVGGAIIQGRQLFLIFPSKGGVYSREVINRGMAIIWRNTVPFLTKNGSCEGIGPKGRASCIRLCWVRPGKTHTIALHYSWLKKTIMMKQADAVKKNALLKTPKKCKPQLLRSSPFYLPIPLVKGGGGEYATNIWV